MLSNTRCDGLYFDGVEVFGGFVWFEFDKLLHVHVVTNDDGTR